VTESPSIRTLKLRSSQPEPFHIPLGIWCSASQAVVGVPRVVLEVVVDDVELVLVVLVVVLMNII